MYTEETIIAKSAAPGGGARGIIRMSGPNALEGVRSFFEPALEYSDRCFVRTGSVFPWQPERPVPALLFFWPEKRSYTGRSTVEIHTIGSPPILDAIIDAACRTGQVRMARPGEFTLQAFLAGRLDLTQAEAVLGIIDATDDASLKVALDQMAGGITSTLNKIRETLFDALAHLEAGFDFADEDIEFITIPEVRCVLEETLACEKILLRRMDARKQSGEKPRVVLSGPPNVGKSSLFNALLQQERVIVSSQPGTTRDYIEAVLVEDGMPFVLVDTAGIGESAPATDIDEMSLSFSRELLERADIILACRENTADFPCSSDPRVIRIVTKVDLTVKEERSNKVGVSSKTGDGLAVLRSLIVARIRRLYRFGEIVPDTASRCRSSLRRSLESLEASLSFLDAAESFFDESLLASMIREAVSSLEEIDGKVYADDVLNRIFENFCIGK